MKSFLLFVFFLFSSSFLNAAGFTVASYNVGGLSGYYDMVRAAAMEKLMQERYREEPEQMSLNEKMQQLALELLFSEDKEERALAEERWEREGFAEVFEQVTRDPARPDSPHAPWLARAEAMVTSYRQRPVVIYDQEVEEALANQLRRLTRSEKGSVQELLGAGYAVMAEEILRYQLPFDILCLQEADYMEPSLFPPSYELSLSGTSHSRNGVAWNSARFALVTTHGNFGSRAHIVELRERETGRRVAVASCHLTGCDPYREVIDPATGRSDAAAGNEELRAVLTELEKIGAEVTIIGMDSNVTALHPRLHALKEAEYRIDYKNYLETTCTNPHLIVNTRLDWIALKTKEPASITNIPVLSVGLNQSRGNMSDHKPIAARIDMSILCPVAKKSTK